MWSKLSFTIADYIKKKGLEAPFKENEVCVVWKSVVEELYPSSSIYSKAVGVQNNILKVFVSQPIWVSEFEGNKKALIEKIVVKTRFPIQNILFIYNHPVPKN
ncbi:MAG: hypothetical protein HYV65_01695 [Candidatus Spechtbacteria bacterium]|nr:hypothetical protein [Candidatus Spechtbacteria bacterium]